MFTEDGPPEILLFPELTHQKIFGIVTLSRPDIPLRDIPRFGTRPIIKRLLNHPNCKSERSIMFHYGAFPSNANAVKTAAACVAALSEAVVLTFRTFPAYP